MKHKYHVKDGAKKMSYKKPTKPGSKKKPMKYEPWAKAKKK